MYLSPFKHQPSLQFLDAVAAFDKCEHPIMLSQLYHAGVQYNLFDYFQHLHSRAETFVKWNGLMTNKTIKESIGTHQGGKSTAEEFKLYNNEMVRDLELACTNSDMMAGHPTSVVALADDCAPTATDSEPPVDNEEALIISILDPESS
jgi:hypothetical protein